MSDSIKQVLGFDASGAIASIGNLSKSLTAMSSRMRNSAESAAKFNAAGQALTNMLARLAPQAGSAAANFARLSANLKNASGAAQAFGNPLGRLENKLTAAHRAGRQLAGGLDSIGASAVRSARGLDKIKAGNLATVASRGNAAAQAIAKLNNALNNTPKPNYTPPPVPSKNGGVNVSWQTIGRVLQTQALLRGLGEITGALHYAGASAVEFNQRVAEIRTITTEKDLGRLKDQVAGLAAEFNRPLDDVAEGYYQTLSNQVGNAAESQKFLATALKFSKVAVTETGDSVNLLAGALHAFNRPVEEADAVAARFFKTIELGRVRGAELANVYGRVATVANQLGISNSELNAAFVAMTSKGVRASEAATQISGAMTALIKPSKDGAAAIRSLGFDSGEALVQAYGFQGALQKLVASTDGSTSSISRLVPRVRGLSFVLATTGDSAKTYSNALAKIREAGEEGLDTEFLRQMSTDAEKVTTDLNKLRVFLTKDLGDSLLSTSERVLRLAGGADVISAAISRLLPLLELGAAAGVTAGTVYAASTLKTIAFAEATTALGAAFKGAFGWAGVALAAYEAVAFAADLAEKKFEKGLQARIEAEEKLIDASRKAADKRIQVQEDENGRAAALVAQRLAGVEQSYEKEIAAAKSAADALAKTTESSLKALLGAREDYLHQLERKVAEEKRLKESAVEKIATDRHRRENEQFEEGLAGKTESEKVTAYVEHAQTAAATARRLRSNPDSTPAELAESRQSEQEGEDWLRKAKTVRDALRRELAGDTRKVSTLKGRLADQQSTLANRNQLTALATVKRQSTAEYHEQLATWKQANAQLQGLHRKNPKLFRPGGTYTGTDPAILAQVAELQRQVREKPAQRTQAQLAKAAKLKAERGGDVEKSEREIIGAEGQFRKQIEIGDASRLKNVTADEEKTQALAQKTREINHQLDALTKEVVAGDNPFNKKGELLPADKRNENLKKSRAALTKILEMGLGSGDDATDRRIADLQQSLSKRLTPEEIQKLQVAPQAIDDLFGQIQAGIDNKTLLLKGEIDFAKLTGHDATRGGTLDVGELHTGVKESGERLRQLQREREEIEPTREAIKTHGALARKLAQEAEYTGSRPGKGNAFTRWVDSLSGNQGKSGGRYEQMVEFNRLRADVQAMAKGKGLTAESLATVEGRYKKLYDPEQYGRAGATETTDSLIGRPAIFKQLGAAIEELKKYKDSVETLRKNQAATINGADELKTLEAAEQARQREAKATGQEAKDLAEKEQQAWAKLAATRQQAKQTWDEYNPLNDKINPVIEQFNKDVDAYKKNPNKTEEQRNALQERLRAFQPDEDRRDELWKQGNKLNKQIEVEKRQAEQAQRQAKAAAERAAAAEAAALTQSLNPAAKIAQLAQWTANGFERAAKAVGRIRPLPAPDALKDPNDVVAAHGGTIRRFAAGGAVGTDTVPAMLTPGEMVWNAATSRQFYSQLTAINAGSRAPASYQSNITNVGDVYLGGITVPGGPTTAATARALADATRRELRRRT